MSIDNLNDSKYKEGFVTDVESESFPAGLDEQVVRNLSALNDEPEWLLDFRLKAYRRWIQMEEPDWSELNYTPVDYQALSYHSAPTIRDKDDIPQEILDTFEIDFLNGWMLPAGRTKVVLTPMDINDGGSLVGWLTGHQSMEAS